MSDAQPTFSIERIYVKDVSLEVPGGAQTFMKQDQPQLEVQITQQSQRMNEALVEVTLVVTVTAKSGDKVLFLVEASQAGVFQIRNVDEIGNGLARVVQRADGATLRIWNTKSGDKVLFLVEASQAGVFQIRNVAESDLPPLLGIVCPNVLFPYARETVSDLITRAGFPPVLLAPVNFEAIYQQRAAAPKPDEPRIEVAH